MNLCVTMYLYTVLVIQQHFVFFYFLFFFLYITKHLDDAKKKLR